MIASCGKDYDHYSVNITGVDTTWKSPTSINTDLQKLFSDIAVTPLIMDVNDISNLDTLFFPGPAVLMIPAHSCNNPGGAAAVGTAKVELTLLHTKGEFIRSSKPTCIEHAPVLTKIIANVRILQNGSELQLKAGNSIVVSVTDPYPVSNLKTFYAEPLAPNRPYIDWTPASDGSLVSPFTRPVPGMTGQYLTGYDLKLAQLRWMNCGSFGDTSSHDQMSVTLPLTFTNANTAVFIVPRDLPTVIQMDAESRHQYFRTDKMPDGQSLKAVSISYVNGEYYVGSTDATSSEGLNVVVKPEKTTLEGLLTFLKGL